MEQNDRIFDVVVIGAGGSGLTAALAASEFGSRVLVVETTRATGGHTSMTQGMFPAAHAGVQIEKGLNISAEDVYRDIMRSNGNDANSELVMQLCRYSGQAVDWLVSYVGQQMIPVTEFRYYGFSVSSIVSPASRTGLELTNSLRRKAEDDGNIIIADSRSATITWDGETGDIAAEVAGSHEKIYGKKYIVAAGGFGANRTFVSKYIPGAQNLMYFGSSQHDGTAVRIASNIGLKLDYMDSYQAHSSVSVTGNLLSWESVLKGSIIVNTSGKRFAEEKIGYSEFAAKLASQNGGFGYEIIPDSVYREMVSLYQEFTSAEKQGGIKRINSVSEVSDLIGCDPSAIKESLFSLIGRHDGSDSDAFPEGIFPLHVAKIYPALFHTLGGIATDKYFRAVHEDGQISHRIYAVGDSAAGISGHGPGGYLSGSGLLMAIVGGYIAGRHAVGKLK